MTFQEKLADLEKKSEFIKNELAKNNIDTSKYGNDPAQVIKWMNEINDKVRTRDEINESLSLAIKVLMGMNKTMAAKDYIEDMHFALFQLADVVHTMTKLLEKKGII